MTVSTMHCKRSVAWHIRAQHERCGGGGKSPTLRAKSVKSCTTGRGRPVDIGTNDMTREICNGETPASPSRWPVSGRTNDPI